MRIIAFGDIHGDPGSFAAIPGLSQADLVILTGDLTNFGGREDAATVLRQVKAVHTKILALPGNLDRKDVSALLDDKGITLHGRGRLLDASDASVALHGVGGSNITPFATPNEYSEEEIANLLAAGFNEIADAVRNGSLHLLVAHPPPLNTKTDKISAGVHVGSRAVRQFIETHQPALCLTGHIHEARAVDTIGATTIINPGMVQDGGYIDISIRNDVAAASIGQV